MIKLNKEKLKNIAIGLVFMILGTIITGIALAKSNIDLKRFEDVYLQDVTNVHNVEKQLDTAKDRLCVSERELANAKLEKYLDKELELSKEDLVRLMDKSKWTCNEEPVIKQVPDVGKTIEEPFNLDCWAKAVATAETGDCTTGMGVTKNNCFGIMTWENGYREGKTYNSKEESYIDFKELWKNKYNNSLPSLQTIKTYTGNDHPLTWQKNTMATYNTCINELIK